jgi:hypothetical protein
MGIKPSGLGERLRFRQYAEPKPCGYALDGESNSFASLCAVPFGTSSAFLRCGFVALLAAADALVETPPLMGVIVIRVGRE